MWLRRGERKSRRGAARVDRAGFSVDLNVRLHDGGGGRRVRVSERDADGDAPAGLRLHGEDVVLRVHDGRIVLREAHGRRETVRLSVPVESCVSAAVDEVRMTDGSARLRLELRVEFGTFVREPLSFSLLFPTTCRYRLAELLHLISWSVSPLPLMWWQEDRTTSDGGTAPGERTSVDAPRSGAPMQCEQDEPEEPLTVTETVAPASNLPRQGPRPDAAPAFGQLVVTGVPDTGDWVSFHPLPTSSEVFTYRSRAEAGIGGR